jgi:broad specificity phosphatase PhoE
MRHAQVAYFGEGGAPVQPDEVRLTEEGLGQARAAADTLRGIELDRVITSGLPRTLETAAIVAPGRGSEAWPELREIESGRVDEIADEDLEETFLGAFRGTVSEERPFLGGETIGALLDRVLPALDRLVADGRWSTALAVLHGGVNRAILSRALTGRRTFVGNLEQAPACINVLDHDDEWLVRAVNVTPYDPAHLRPSGRETTMEELLRQYLPFRARGAAAGGKGQANR